MRICAESNDRFSSSRLLAILEAALGLDATEIEPRMASRVEGSPSTTLSSAMLLSASPTYWRIASPTMHVPKQTAGGVGGDFRGHGAEEAGSCGECSTTRSAPVPISGAAASAAEEGRAHVGHQIPEEVVAHAILACAARKLSSARPYLVRCLDHLNPRRQHPSPLYLLLSPRPNHVCGYASLQVRLMESHHPQTRAAAAATLIRLGWGVGMGGISVAALYILEQMAGDVTCSLARLHARVLFASPRGCPRRHANARACAHKDTSLRLQVCLWAIGKRSRPRCRCVTTGHSHLSLAPTLALPSALPSRHCCGHLPHSA